jgi:hypothetical protein
VRLTSPTSDCTDVLPEAISSSEVLGYADRGILKLSQPAGRANSYGMAFPRYTAGITRQDLAQQCLREVRLWPGCETVGELAVLMGNDGKFTVHVVDYGASSKSAADRALRCIQREKARHFHLEVD